MIREVVDFLFFMSMVGIVVIVAASIIRFMEAEELNGREFEETE